MHGTAQRDGVPWAAKDGALNYKCQAERARTVPAYAIRVKRPFPPSGGGEKGERDFIRVTFVRRVSGQPSNSISRSVSFPWTAGIH